MPMLPGGVDRGRREEGRDARAGVDHALLHQRRRAAGDVDLVPVDLGGLEAVGRGAGAGRR